MFKRIQAGFLPPELADMLSAGCHDDHDKTIASLNRAATYPILDLVVEVPPNLYHPHPASSSAFILRTLLRERQPLGHLLELGCGTGVLSLALLKQGLADRAVMSDNDPVAIGASEANARNAGLTDRVQILAGDLFAPVQAQQFDTILFNLPLMHGHHARTGHPALDDVTGRLAGRFFEQVDRHLNPGGSAYFSYSNLSCPALLAQFSERIALELVAGEWVASSGFWLFVYRARARGV
jgi:methylase of polypeptide subunit release factors